MKTKLFTLMFAIVASMNLWAADSGSCGDHLTWTLDDNGILTISGTGDMNDYNYSSPWPWSNKNIKTVIINAGVTSIGNSAFYYCTGLTSITIPNSVTSIGERAFDGCSSLTTVTIDSDHILSKEYSSSTDSYGNPTNTIGCLFNSHVKEYIIGNSVTSIGYNAFYWCDSLKSITIGNSVTNIGYDAFSHCGLTSVTIPGNVKKNRRLCFFQLRTKICYN